LKLPEADAYGRVRCHLLLESGEEHAWEVDLDVRDPVAREEVDGAAHVIHALEVRDLPLGYHRLTAEAGDRLGEALLIAAPGRAYAPAWERRAWGVFLPLYALRTDRDWGIGDLTDLHALGEWIGGHGGAVVGSLPLLPTYLGARLGEGPEEPFDPSPYRAVSRLFWNELYVDVERAPELARSERARDLLGSAELSRSRAEHRAARHVDWRAVAATKGPVLGELARSFFDDPGDRRSDLETLVAERPEVEEYALFRGAVARYGSAWWKWPEPLRERKADLDDVDLATARHHLYGQLLAYEQSRDLAAQLRAAGRHPYLDLPVGTRLDGFDVWAHREVFALHADTGAPPDTVFAGGQNWRVPPLHPDRLRETGYRHLREVLHHHLQLADVLRIDHVMGLHRLFWIPEGVDAAQGVYVRYPADELYAVFLLEAHRQRSVLVGENLGTVPTEVEEGLQARGIVRMYVVQYEADPEACDVLPPVPGDTVASVNTHDMAPFAAWWRGEDVEDGLDLGHLDEEDVARSREDRGTVRWKVASLLRTDGRIEDGDADDPEAVAAGLVEWLGAGDARLVLANLEDLWGETEPQNVPGTEHERPNWRRRAALSLEEMRDHEDVRHRLGRLDAARGRAG
ncbi:MAG: 4-alpha-glucanotransferase, partial [Nitriliruptorales bacterium]